MNKLKTQREFQWAFRCVFKMRLRFCEMVNPFVCYDFLIFSTHSIQMFLSPLFSYLIYNVTGRFFCRVAKKGICRHRQTCECECELIWQVSRWCVSLFIFSLRYKYDSPSCYLSRLFGAEIIVGIIYKKKRQKYKFQTGKCM